MQFHATNGNDSGTFLRPNANPAMNDMIEMAMRATAEEMASEGNAPRPISAPGSGPSTSYASQPPATRSSSEESHYVEGMFSIQLLSQVDLLSSAVGACICFMFLKTEGLRTDRETPFPWEQAIGMIFTTSVCPLMMYWNARFYEKWRNVVVILLRMSFILGTLAHYDDVPHRKFDSWPGFIGMVLYTARCLVISWGGFGWLLPFRYHIWMQGIHALLAFHLIPETCVMPSTLGRETFVSLNEDRWRKMAAVLDWPLVLFGGAPSKALQSNTSAWATCVGLNMYFVIVLGWVLPSLAISYLYPRLSTGARALLRRDGIFLLGLGCTLYWVVLRLFLAVAVP
jgi:hypothetical protein